MKINSVEIISIIEVAVHVPYEYSINSCRNSQDTDQYNDHNQSPGVMSK